MAVEPWWLTLHLKMYIVFHKNMLANGKLQLQLYQATSYIAKMSSYSPLCMSYNYIAGMNMASSDLHIDSYIK